jgi:hypothetical protein
MNKCKEIMQSQRIFLEATKSLENTNNKKQINSNIGSDLKQNKNFYPDFYKQTEN